MQGVEQNFKRTGRNPLERIETASMKQEHDAIEKDQERDFALKNYMYTHMTYTYIPKYVSTYICMCVLENLPKMQKKNKEYGKQKGKNKKTVRLVL